MADNKKRSGGMARQIDENLKRVFKEKVDEDLPPRLLELIEELKKKGGEDKQDND